MKLDVKLERHWREIIEEDQPEVFQPEVYASFYEILRQESKGLEGWSEVTWTVNGSRPQGQRLKEALLVRAIS